MRLYPHIYIYGLLLLCLAGCAEDKADPPLNDAEKQLLGKWYLNRTEKTMYVPSLGPDVLADYYNWNDAAEGWIEFRENREMTAGNTAKSAGMDPFSRWQLTGTQLQVISAGAGETALTLQYKGDSLQLTEPHSPDYNRQFYFSRQPKKFFFPAAFTRFLGRWYVYKVSEYDLNGQLLLSNSFPNSTASFMILENEWLQQQGYTYIANCHQCPATDSWKPLLLDNKLFIFSASEYYDVQFSDSTHMELRFPGLHFPLTGPHPGRTFRFEMEKE